MHVLNRIRNRFAAVRHAIKQQNHQPPSERDELVTALRSQDGMRVLQGPFAGMRYVDVSHGSVYLAKLLGTYEQELHPLWQAERLAPFRTIINLGCGEGYYLAGLGRLLRLAGRDVPRLIGFDVDLPALDSTRKLLELNDLPPAELAADGFAASLASACGPTLVICDIEGAEEMLLDPAHIPQLKTTAIIAEIHDEPGDDRRLQLIRGWFSPTHAIEQIDARSRTLEDFPARHLRVSGDAMLEAMNEQRLYGNRWLNMTPRNG